MSPTVRQDTRHGPHTPTVPLLLCSLCAQSDGLQACPAFTSEIGDAKTFEAPKSTATCCPEVEAKKSVCVGNTAESSTYTEANAIDATSRYSPDTLGFLKSCLQCAPPVLVATDLMGSTLTPTTKLFGQRVYGKKLKIADIRRLLPRTEVRRRLRMSRKRWPMTGFKRSLMSPKVYNHWMVTGKARIVSRRLRPGISTLR